LNNKLGISNEFNVFFCHGLHGSHRYISIKLNKSPVHKPLKRIRIHPCELCNPWPKKKNPKSADGAFQGSNKRVSKRFRVIFLLLFTTKS